MKIKYLFLGGLLSLASLSSCIDDDLNKSPNDIDKSQLKPEWLLNTSISNAQMDPHIAERIFVLSWKQASRFDRPSSGGVASGADNAGWTGDYLSNSWGTGWLSRADLAVKLAQARVDNADFIKEYPYYKNVLQVARIWRVYLISELVDVMGPIPVFDAFEGTNPNFNSEKDIYAFMLNELKEATEGIVESNGSFEGSTDLFYGGKPLQWQKYGNSLRMRLAMRLTAVDKPLAKQHFEDAATKPFISTQADIANVVEKDGWSPFSGVMSRPWNAQNMSKTFYNLVVGLGGQDFAVPTTMAGQLKDAKTNLGLRLLNHLPLNTNDPSAGYLFDGIPSKVDPRAPVMYHITGYRDPNGIYPEVAFGTLGDELTKDKEGRMSREFKVPFLKEGVNSEGKPKMDTVLILDIAKTWYTVVGGRWSNPTDKKGELSTEYTSKTHKFPSLANKYRKSTGKRVFFGPWESYFLLAEAKFYGWNVPGTTQDNYEKGIAASFDYHGVSAQLGAYLSSADYNRVGTSVSFGHTVEATDYTMNYKDGYTGALGTTTYRYPKNSIYNGGATNNDVLTKIITQKYIAQVPWLPLEAWSDHRRLGLPFFENQAVEVDYDTQTQVPLTVATAKDCEWKYYPKRFRYPSTWLTIYPAGYNQAVELLGGQNLSTTPLWWNHK